jgi:hypothetical protein
VYREALFVALSAGSVWAAYIRRDLFASSRFGGLGCRHAQLRVVSTYTLKLRVAIQPAVVRVARVVEDSERAYWLGVSKV